MSESKSKLIDCPDCGRINNAAMDKCRECGNSLSVLTLDEFDELSEDPILGFSIKKWGLGIGCVTLVAFGVFISSPFSPLASGTHKQVKVETPTLPEEQFNLGVRYATGEEGLSKDPVLAMKWIRLAADQGHAGAQESIGFCCATVGDFGGAEKWYRLAANQGHEMAQLSLGMMYETGDGVPQDYAESMKWYRLAANQGHETAQYVIGRMYYNGEGVPQDYAESMKWYRLAANQGVDSAQFNLAQMYRQGLGVPKDNAKAVKWYRLAVDQGHANAQGLLGWMYYNGQGVPQDYDEGVKWYRLAANQGHETSQANLGLAYANGQGVPKDIVLAYAWFNLAAANEHEGAEQFKKLLLEDMDMTKEQVAEAQKLSRALFRQIEENN
jgi:uncharacterized protein